MGKRSLIQDLKAQVKQIDAEIKHCKDRIENAKFGSDYDKELDELMSDRKQLEKQIDDLKSDESNVGDSLQLSIKNLFHQLTEKIRKLTETTKIRAIDKNVMEDHLKKHNKELGDYSIHIKIEKLEKKGKDLVAERTIVIENINTGQARQYSAGHSKEQLWHVNFDKDLETGEFEKT